MSAAATGTFSIRDGAAISAFKPGAGNMLQEIPDHQTHGGPSCTNTQVC